MFSSFEPLRVLAAKFIKSASMTLNLFATYKGY
jgi:hypothetical protein